MVLNQSTALDASRLTLLLLSTGIETNLGRTVCMAIVKHAVMPSMRSMQQQIRCLLWSRNVVLYVINGSQQPPNTGSETKPTRTVFAVAVKNAEPKGMQQRKVIILLMHLFKSSALIVNNGSLPLLITGLLIKMVSLDCAIFVKSVFTKHMLLGTLISVSGAIFALLHSIASVMNATNGSKITLMLSIAISAISAFLLTASISKTSQRREAVVFAILAAVLRNLLFSLKRLYRDTTLLHLLKSVIPSVIVKTTSVTIALQGKERLVCALNVSLVLLKLEISASAVMTIKSDMQTSFVMRSSLHMATPV